MNLPIVATLHHAIHTPGLEPYKGRLRSLYHRYWIRPAERRTVQRADVVVAVSKFAAEAARRALFDRSMTVIYNGVDIERFHPPRERKPHQPFRLLYVGKWTTMKGADLLAPIMRELGNDFELRYTGDPSAGRDPAATPTNMHDIGRLRSDNDIVAAMQGADALLFPSRCEGFGLVVVEAMACGLPVIGTRGSSLLEIIDDRATGALCRMDDVFSYAEEGRALMRHPERTARMSSMARDRAEARFSIKHMVDAYVSLYEKHRI